MPPDVIASGSWLLIHVLFILSLILGLLGTTALYAATALRAGTLGLWGFVMWYIGMIIIGLDYYEVFMAPYFKVSEKKTVGTPE